MRFNLTRRMALTLAGSLPLGAAFASPAPVDPQSRSFDFLAGRWNVHHRKLRKRLEASEEWLEFGGSLYVQPILGGLGNFDRNELGDPSGAYEAHSLRLYNPGTNLWSIWWLDSRAPALDPPVIGRFEGAKGRFYADESFAGRPIRVRTTYELLSPAAAQWTQAFSADAGRSWEVNWIMDFERPDA